MPDCFLDSGTQMWHLLSLGLFSSTWAPCFVLTPSATFLHCPANSGWIFFFPILLVYSAS